MSDTPPTDITATLNAMLAQARTYEQQANALEKQAERLRGQAEATRANVAQITEAMQPPAPPPAHEEGEA